MGFTAAQAARLTGCTLSQLSSWERIGLVAPPPGTHRYRIQDLVALRVVASLLDAGLGLSRIHHAVGFLVESGAEEAPRSLVTDGETVWPCRDDGQVLEALRRGQLAVFVALDRITADVEAEVRAFDDERQAFVKGLHDGEPDAADASASGAAGSDRAGGASAHARPRRRAMPR